MFTPDEVGDEMGERLEREGGRRLCGSEKTL
jgi:hypothetical protein